MADLGDTLQISTAGMRVQGDRLRIVAENIANAESVSTVPGGIPTAARPSPLKTPSTAS